MSAAIVAPPVPRLVAPMLVALGLAACIQGPQRGNETGPTPTDRLDRRAGRYCARYGLDARLIDTDRQDGKACATCECR